MLSTAPTRRRASLPGFALLFIAAAAPAADGPEGADSASGSGARTAVHGQGTFVEQATDGFHAPYSGANSLSPHIGRETVDLTLIMGVRLWQGAEVWAAPEIDQGFGLDNTLGMAGFPSAEAYKVGSSRPYFRLPRLFVRQTLSLGADSQPLDAAAYQFAGTQSADRWVFTVGKFGVTDIFDTNRYAHDPRADFLNWTAIDAGTFDYAADAWGFTVGAAAERYLDSWTVRAGLFDLSIVPNSPSLDPGLHQFQLVGEIEHRYRLLGQQGRAMITGYESRARLGELDLAIARAQATHSAPDASLVRRFRSRAGISVNIEQPLGADVGLFARAGQAGGGVEADEFTDIDRSLAAGMSLGGTRWQRAGDTVGLVLMQNAISGIREAYLAHGGLGILVGDGRLPHPGPEQVLESYYRYSMTSWASLSFDYQWARNPAYNRDRGPVSIFAVRLHAEF